MNLYSGRYIRLRPQFQWPSEQSPIDFAHQVAWNTFGSPHHLYRLGCSCMKAEDMLGDPRSLTFIYTSAYDSVVPRTFRTSYFLQESFAWKNTWIGDDKRYIVWTAHMQISASSSSKKNTVYPGCILKLLNPNRYETNSSELKKHRKLDGAGRADSTE